MEIPEGFEPERVHPLHGEGRICKNCRYRDFPPWRCSMPGSRFARYTLNGDPILRSDVLEIDFFEECSEFERSRRS